MTNKFIIFENAVQNQLFDVSLEEMKSLKDFWPTTDMNSLFTRLLITP
jgi:hypothetical protein